MFGGYSTTRMDRVLAFLAIYLIWGSTYLAIRWAVDSIPPLLMMALRCGAAGVILAVWGAIVSPASIDRRHWRSAFVAGALLFLFCHGSLAWAEQRVASGEASLLAATTPLWMTVIDWRWGARRRPGWIGVAGLAIGFAGVAMLVAPASRVVTHAYINPLVAVGIGAAFAGEGLTASTIVAALTIVAGVMLALVDRY